MYKVDIQNKSLIELSKARFATLGLKERFDIQEWVEKTPTILGEELLIIAKEYVLPSRTRLDLLAIDKQANLVVIELKRDESGSTVEWQSIKYASYCSSFTHDEIYQIYAQYLETNEDEAELEIERFIDEEPDKLNDSQRIILVAKEFHSDVASAVLWLRDYSVDIQCVKLTPFTDANNDLFLSSSIIIPLPEAKDYIKRKETKIKEKAFTKSSSFSLERTNLPDHKLRVELIKSFTRDSKLTPRVKEFFRILLSEDKSFDREEIKLLLFGSGIGEDIGQTGRFLSNISQFLTKKSNPHLRQVVEFESGGTQGDTKHDYKIRAQYRDLVQSALLQTTNNSD